MTVITMHSETAKTGHIQTLALRRIWGKTKERARHVDLDNAGENKLLGVVNWR